MSPITHFLASWSVADSFRLAHRDRAFVCLAGIAPDMDGLVVLVDLGARALGRPDPALYGVYHHALTHGLPAALLIAALTAAFAERRAKAAALAFLVVHLHVLCDLVGSRGGAPEDIWPLHYLAPLWREATLEWSGQWALNAWPNVVLTVALMGLVMVRAVRRGYSPVGLVSRRGDAAFVAALRARLDRR